MADYLLDTNHAAALVTLGHPLRQRVLLRLQAGDAFAITVPVVAETLYGIGLLRQFFVVRPEFAGNLPGTGFPKVGPANSGRPQRAVRRQNPPRMPLHPPP